MSSDTRPGRLVEGHGLRESIALARARLAGLDPVDQARRAGCRVQGAGPSLEAVLDLVGRPARVWLRGELAGQVVSAAGEPLAPLEQAIVLHYLVHGVGQVPPPTELIGFVDVKDAAFYGEPFRRRVEARVEQAFGRSGADLSAAALSVGGEVLAGLADAAVRVRALPLVPVTIVLWLGDEELGPAAKVLFGDNVGSLLGVEDLVALAQLVVRAMIGSRGARIRG